MTTPQTRARILFASEQYPPWGRKGGNGVEKDFGGWISLLFHKLRKRVNAEVQTLGLTGIQSHALHYILAVSYTHLKQKSGFAISKPDLKRDGTPSRARTVDKLIKSQLLYQLS